MQTYVMIGMAVWILADIYSNAAREVYQTGKHNRAVIVIGVFFGIMVWPLVVLKFTHMIVSVLTHGRS